MQICILGATGLVGSELLDLIARAWPDATLHLYASSDKSLEHGGKKHPVYAATRLEQDDAPRGDVAFVALDDDFSARYCPRLVELGYRVIDKSNTYRMNPDVPLVVAGVNSDLVTAEVKLVANPNCTTIPFALAVAPLMRRWGLRGATVSSYQAISGAGAGALDGFLDASKQGYAEANRIGTQFDPKGYAGNTVPHNGKTDDSGFSSEERKLMLESRKILGLAETLVSAQCCRVPVAVGHYENAWVELGQKAEIDDIAEVLQNDTSAPFVRYLPGAAGEGLSALACVHDRDRTLVGRLRKDARDTSGRTVCMTVAADNLRLGAATNAVRIASRWFESADPDLQAQG
jgi:aspartate-semialdehyde dehydrogenase